MNLFENIQIQNQYWYCSIIDQLKPVK